MSPRSTPPSETPSKRQPDQSCREQRRCADPRQRDGSVAGAAGCSKGRDKARGKRPDARRKLLLVRALQTTALESRRRATDAGATADQLRPGDDHNRAAESLVNAGKVSEAAVKLNDATTAWSAAERDARLAATAAAAAAARADENGRGSAEADCRPLLSSSAIAPPQVAPIKPAAPVANPSAEIESAVAAYARAIESRDIAEVRRAYPGITAAQASGFEQFFATVRSLRATFSVSSLDVNGATAEGKLAGTYDYLTNAGKERTPSGDIPGDLPPRRRRLEAGVGALSALASRTRTRARSCR